MSVVFRREVGVSPSELRVSKSKHLKTVEQWSVTDQDLQSAFARPALSCTPTRSLQAIWTIPMSCVCLVWSGPHIVISTNHL